MQGRFRADPYKQCIWLFLFITGSFWGCPCNKNATIWGLYQKPCMTPYSEIQGILVASITCMYAHVLFENTHTHTHTSHIYIYIYMYVDMYVHTYTYTYIHIHTYIYIPIHTYTYIYIHIHTYTYIYIHTYIYIQMYYVFVCIKRNTYVLL